MRIVLLVVAAIGTIIGSIRWLLTSMFNRIDRVESNLRADIRELRGMIAKEGG